MALLTWFNILKLDMEHIFDLEDVVAEQEETQIDGNIANAVRQLSSAFKKRTAAEPGFEFTIVFEANKSHHAPSKNTIWLSAEEWNEAHPKGLLGKPNKPVNIATRQENRTRVNEHTAQSLARSFNKLFNNMGVTSTLGINTKDSATIKLG